MAFLEFGSGCNLSVAQAVTASAASTNMYDVTGAGNGNAPVMIGANGVNTAIGIDIGAGTGGVEEPQVLVTFGTCTTVSGTLTIAVQAAPDNGSYSAGSFYTLASTAALTGATELFAGAQLVLDIPPVPPGFALPRFYQLYYTVGSSISVVVSASITTGAPTSRVIGKYGSNFPGGL